MESAWRLIHVMGGIDMARTADNLREAKRQKNDEFYTMEEDIQKEVDKYKEQLKGKVVYCNCDDYRESNFLKYLGRNFMFFGLKKLICSSYKKGADSVKYYTIEVNEPVEQSTYFDTWETYLHEHTLECDGDFRSPESIELLEEADVVITNPPFSLFREFVAQLFKYDKKFLIIGNQNAVAYKELFPLIKENKMWFGLTFNGGNRWFRMPDDYELLHAEVREDGHKYAFVNGVRWFTNLDNKIRHEELPLITAEENGIEYPHYDNYNAIDIKKVSQIPSDYTGIMGVPITFLGKYNPEQFELLWLASGHSKSSMPNNIKEIVGADFTKSSGYAYINGVQSYHRILIRNKHPEIVED